MVGFIGQDCWRMVATWLVHGSDIAALAATTRSTAQVFPAHAPEWWRHYWPVHRVPVHLRAYAKYLTYRDCDLVHVDNTFAEWTSLRVAVHESARTSDHVRIAMRHAWYHSDALAYYEWDHVMYWPRAVALMLDSSMYVAHNREHVVKCRTIHIAHRCNTAAVVHTFDRWLYTTQQCVCMSPHGCEKCAGARAPRIARVRFAPAQVDAACAVISQLNCSLLITLEPSYTAQVLASVVDAAVHKLVIQIVDAEQMWLDHGAAHVLRAALVRAEQRGVRVVWWIAAHLMRFACPMQPHTKLQAVSAAQAHALEPIHRIRRARALVPEAARWHVTMALHSDSHEPHSALASSWCFTECAHVVRMYEADMMHREIVLTCTIVPVHFYKEHAIETQCVYPRTLTATRNARAIFELHEQRVYCVSLAESSMMMYQYIAHRRNTCALSQQAVHKARYLLTQCEAEAKAYKAAMAAIAAELAWGRLHARVSRNHILRSYGYPEKYEPVSFVAATGDD